MGEPLKFDYYYGIEAEQFSFYRVPRLLIKDERNHALSEKLGWDVYHYYLHVVYVPVVEKEVKWSKRCKWWARRKRSSIR